MAVTYVQGNAQRWRRLGSAQGSEHPAFVGASSRNGGRDSLAFIVSLVKYIVLAICFIFMVVLVFALLWAADNGVFNSPEITIGTIATVIAGAVFFVLWVGGIAILLSIHDRHRELAEGVHRIADELQRISNEKSA